VNYWRSAQSAKDTSLLQQFVGDMGLSIFYEHIRIDAGMDAALQTAFLY
jgi:hypothetical protein